MTHTLDELTELAKQPTGTESRTGITPRDYTVDFPVGHPARGGKNVRVIDTPDGRRAAHNARQQDLKDLAAVGALPPVRDPETGEPLALEPEQLALVYALRRGMTPPLAAEVTQRYRLTAEPVRAGEPEPPALTNQQIALGYIQSLGYTPERAQEILERYGVPDVITQRAADARK